LTDERGAAIAAASQHAMASRAHRTARLFWFLPAVMGVVAMAWAFASTTYGQCLDREFVAEPGWIWTGSAEGARAVLTAIAIQTMTVADVVYSITVTALAQTSSHFGSQCRATSASIAAVRSCSGPSSAPSSTA
jgi:uncharacterized membrane protein